jgi:hypothetical protein
MIEGEGKRTAEAIAERLLVKFREQGWIRLKKVVPVACRNIFRFMRLALYSSTE